MFLKSLEAILGDGQNGTSLCIIFCLFLVSLISDCTPPAIVFLGKWFGQNVILRINFWEAQKF